MLLLLFEGLELLGYLLHAFCIIGEAIMDGRLSWWGLGIVAALSAAALGAGSAYHSEAIFVGWVVGMVVFFAYLVVTEGEKGPFGMDLNL